MYLKTYYTAKFFAALLTMQSKSEKIELYVKTAKSYDVKILKPDINLSEYDFKEIDGSILYGFKTIKGVGEASVNEIINLRPFTGIQNAIETVPKKMFNKRVGVALIKAGAFDFEDSNRFNLLNEFMNIRKDKDERFNANKYGVNKCIEFEREVLGTSITHEIWWDLVLDGTTLVQSLKIDKITKKIDKKQNEMAFVEASHQGCSVRILVFSSLYRKIKALLVKDGQIVVTGKRDGNSIIANKITLDMSA